MKALSNFSWFSGRDLTQISRKYQAGILTTRCDILQTDLQEYVEGDVSLNVSEMIPIYLFS
jgi:hypothetical protein